MNPIYKFILSANGNAIVARPVFPDSLGIDYSLEQGQRFFRGALSGKLTFEGPDYAFIVGEVFDTQFDLSVEISYDNGGTWAQYWAGRFWKTDCEFNEDDQTVIVTTKVRDRYSDILAGMDKEFDLIQLAPDIVHVKIDKRPMIQIYIPGQTVVGCFLSGMWWEQECEPVTDVNALENTYHFYRNKNVHLVDIESTVLPILPNGFSAEYPRQPNLSFEAENDGFRFSFRAGSGGIPHKWAITRISDGVELWNLIEPAAEGMYPPYSVILQPVEGTEAVGTCEVYIHDISIWGRYVCDVQDGTYELRANDIVADNKNYSRVVGYNNPDTLFVSPRLSETPTPWGIYQPGLYYDIPATFLEQTFFPIGRNAWSWASFWFAFSLVDWVAEQQWREGFALRNAYPVASVLSVLLGKIAPGVTHEGTTDYSEFLYGPNPINAIDEKLLITPKSNLINSGYDQPAQKAPITLRQVLDMLRNCFRCYWFIDDDNRLRIEHVLYFENGRSYDDEPGVGINLTEQILTRNGKALAFAQNKYTFEKPDMPERYQFRWMDDVTDLFDGYPIDIISGYVEQGKIEEININNFTSDVDYILLNPGEISQDGFVLMGAEYVGGVYQLPYVDFFFDNTHHVLQNAYVAFHLLQTYYAYDMPARRYAINGVQKTALGMKKMRTQSVKFPILQEPDFLQLIKTGLGNGTIEKLSVNLSSRNVTATLRYATES